MEPEMTSIDLVPDISVCVATCNRARLLPRLIAALEQQSLDPSRFEVVIADDASTDDTQEVLRELSGRSPLHVRVVRNEERGGPASARNLAWRSAIAPFVAFTDDDCVPTPGWLALHLEALGGVDIAQGRVAPDPAQAHGAGPLARSIAVVDENGLYETCNISYRRSWLEGLDGFDPTFRRAGEDADLAWRAKLAGASTTFSADALVYHDVDPFSWRRELRNTRRWAGVVLLVGRYPHLRARFGIGRSWRGAHRPAVLAAGALVLIAWGIASRRILAISVGAAGMAPYTWYRLHAHPVAGGRRQRLKLLGPVFTIDLAELAVITSTRARLWFRSLVGGQYR